MLATTLSDACQNQASLDRVERVEGGVRGIGQGDAAGQQALCNGGLNLEAMVVSSFVTPVGVRRAIGAGIATPCELNATPPRVQ